MQVLLISTYELGRQPFGLASPAAWLQAQGHQVSCADLSVEELPVEIARRANLIAFYLPMHTATRLAVKVIEKIQRLNPQAHLCCYGLYAPLNETYLRSLGVHTIVGGEFEPALVSLADGLVAQSCPVVSLERLQFLTPARSSLPPLGQYAQLRLNGSTKRAGYTEASRGCKHLCRHCPVVPVYQGKFRVVQPEIVMQDIRQQVAAGAQHITFGDPDFFNGPTHAIRIVEALHAEFPTVTYDATIKIEHLLQRLELLPRLKKTGCQLTLAPTFIAFTPWTTRESYRDMLAVLLELNLVEQVPPIQLALRLLIIAGSGLLELDDIKGIVGGFDEPALLYRWKHSDPAVDELAGEALKLAGLKGSRREIFRKLWDLVASRPLPEDFDLMPRATIPYMDEPWYC
jgi:hypothetical protein